MYCAFVQSIHVSLSFHSSTLPCTPDQFPQDDNAKKKASVPRAPSPRSNSLLGVVQGDPKASLSATAFLQDMVLVADKDLAESGKIGETNDLMAWKKLVVGRNLQVDLAELSVVGVD